MRIIQERRADSPFSRCTNANHGTPVGGVSFIHDPERGRVASFNDIGESECSWLPKSTSAGFGSSNSGSARFLIGNRHQVGLYMNGMIDEVRIYNHALSTEEVQLLFNSQ